MIHSASKYSLNLNQLAFDNYYNKIILWLKYDRLFLAHIKSKIIAQEGFCGSDRVSQFTSAHLPSARLQYLAHLSKEAGKTLSFVPRKRKRFG